MTHPAKRSFLRDFKTAGTVLLIVATSLVNASSNNADFGRNLEEIRVIGTSLSGKSLDLNNIPYASQEFTASQLGAPAFYSPVALLESSAGSVSSNAAQNNRLQPDIQYRGFVASPLLGLSQGLAVYQNGVRINEAFGDTVNWDLLSSTSMQSMTLMGGSNPVYGLNTIGGALVLETKTGFSSQNGEVSITAGDYGTRDYSGSYGYNNGRWGIYVALDKMEEDGWRDFSDSEAQSLYTGLSWRGDTSELDVFLNYADTNLKGNGSVPLDLLSESRSAVFTHPDQTENELLMISSSFRHTLNSGDQLSINGFYRDTETRTFNGDGAEYEECGEDDEDDADADAIEHPFEGFLCNDSDTPVTDQDGMLVSEDFNAINNRSLRLQDSYGLTLQYLGLSDLAGFNHQYMAGIDYFKGKTTFNSSVEYSQLTESRGTTLTGRYDDEGSTHLNTEVETWSGFLSDNLSLSDSVSLTLSARYNNTRSMGSDPTGKRPELAGNHRFQSFNVGAGLLWDVSQSNSLYTNLQSSSRTPTPVELACSHPDAPCTLPNSFLADPPLDDVRSISAELGMRGTLGFIDQYQVGAFIISAENDIVFQTTGGTSSNQGFFQNAADTRRMGIELQLAGGDETWNWYVHYTYLQATFESSFFSSTPNHPAAGDDGKLPVASGSDIPLIPDHNLKVGASLEFTEQIRIGFDYRYQDGVHLRGDEANVDHKTSNWSVVDFYARTTLGEHLFIEARVDNVFDKQYETFGLYGEADEVLGEVEDESGRFLGPAMPRMWWLTIGATF